MSVVTLTYRQLTKEDNFFLVQYQEDDFLQVRGRGFLHTVEKVRNSRFFFYKKKKKKMKAPQPMYPGYQILNFKNKALSESEYNICLLSLHHLLETWFSRIINIISS